MFETWNDTRHSARSLLLRPRHGISIVAPLALAIGATITVSSVVTGCSSGQAPQLIQGDLAFTNVNVVPMDRDHILRNHTVVVTDGVISAVAPTAEIQLSGDMTVVDGSGRYLMPGLFDMHVHLRNEADLPVYLANGVTTVLNMGGPSRLLEWRERIEAGMLVGPHLLVSFFIDGPGGRGGIVQTPEAARNAVTSASESGYDYIKVYNSLTTEQFTAIVAEANQQGISVIGHGVRAPGMEGILEGGQIMVAHGEEYIYTHFGNTTNRALIPSAIELTRRTGAYLIPNLSAFEIMTVQWGRPAAVDSFLSLPATRYLHPSYRNSWQSGRYTSRNGSIASRLTFLRELTKAFADAGLPLILGTDSPGIPGMFPGYSIQDDLRNMIVAGLSPYQALSAGTRTPGEFLAVTRPGSTPVGTVSVGSQADLVLLSDNPLNDVSNTETPLGVMVGGVWRSRETLDEMLESLAVSFGS